jgi:anaerobic ribonucleoside-triphosphate reductase
MVTYNNTCRAFLSPWYERGGMKPADDDDKPVFVGRFNIGAVSLHLPMILAKSRKENKDFYEVLDYYLEMIRGIHKRTYDYLGEMKASTNPLGYCEGGFYGGHLNPHDKIKPILKPMTASFGITALNELQQLYNGKSITEDGEFALEVMNYINYKVNKFKEEDGYLYALYGTPAESLCFTGDTLVNTENGTTKISELKEGDKVYSYNNETKEIELKPVGAARETRKEAVVINLTFQNGTIVECTPDHPFGAINAYGELKWVKAEDLRRFHKVKTINGFTKIHDIQRVLKLQTVYNIEVEDNNNYFVGGDDAILVHNCGLQIKQFRQLYGIVENVSDRPYVSNSFHCHVSEDIDPIEKQDLEGRFWNLFNGGKIQYVRYPISYNKDAIKTLVNRAMKKGYYEGVNLALGYCDDCGHQELEMDVCPKCGSKNLTLISRMNGEGNYVMTYCHSKIN